jgi:hypothetical protein
MRPSLSVLSLCAFCLTVISLALAQDSKSDKPAARDRNEPSTQAGKFDAARFIKDHDKDGDGKISRDEAKAIPKEEFDKMDLNHEGFLDADELLKAALACGCDPATKAKACRKRSSCRNGTRMTRV